MGVTGGMSVGQSEERRRALSDWRRWGVDGYWSGIEEPGLATEVRR